MKLKSPAATYENAQPINTEQHATLIVTIEKKLKPDSQLKNGYYRAKVTTVNPFRIRRGRLRPFVSECIGHVCKLLEEVANYGDPVARHAYSSRESRYDERVTQESKAPHLIIPEQRSFSAAVYAR